MLFAEFLWQPVLRDVRMGIKLFFFLTVIQNKSSKFANSSHPIKTPIHELY